MKGLTRELMALRVAGELTEGMYVNLGIGLPTMVSSYIPPDIEVMLQSQNGVLNYGAIVEEDQWDPDLINAGGQPTVLKPGASFFDSATAFGMIRGCHIDVAVLGAYQVSETGDIANWALDEKIITGVGGAMDICCGVNKVFVVMEHVTPDGQPRIKRKCSFPLTARGVVSTIFTNLAVIDVVPGGLRLREVAHGITAAEVQHHTEAKLIVPGSLKEMSL